MRLQEGRGEEQVSSKALWGAALTCVCAILAAPAAPASIPATDTSPPPPCVTFLGGYSAPSDHRACTAALGDAVVSCAHDKDSTADQTYDDSDCFARLGTLLRADCSAAQGTVSGAPYDATGCGLVAGGTLLLACSSEGGSPGPGRGTSRYSSCTAGPVSCSVTMFPDPRYDAPGSVAPDCPAPAPRRR
jgi:hypothetical protein